MKCRCTRVALVDFLISQWLIHITMKPHFHAQFLIGFLLLSLAASAQLPFEWAISAGSDAFPGLDASNAVTTDAAGNVYITGTFLDTTDFDPGAGVYELVPAGDADAFVLKLDAAGNFVWAVSFGAATTIHETGYEIAVGPDGNIYTSGLFNSTADFDPGAGVFNMTSAGASDIYLLCLDPNASFVWCARFGGTSGEHIYSITFDDDGNLIAGGDFYNTVDFDPGAGVYNLTSFGLYDGFILKLDPAHNFVWAGRIGGASGSETVSQVVTDTAGNVYSTGTFEGTTDFNPTAAVTNLFSDGNGEPFLAKWTGSCTLVWASAIRGIPNANGAALAVDAAGNVYGTGRFWGVSDFDPGAGTATTSWHGDYDIYVWKLNSNGALRWAAGIGSATEDFGRSLVLDEEANIYVAGYFTGTVDFDPGAGTTNLSASGSSYDAFLLSLDSAGSFIWAKDLSGTGSVQIFDMHRDAAGNIYTTGGFGITTDFDPGPGVTNLTSNGGQDFFVQKYFECSNFGYTIAPAACSAYTSPSGNHVWTSSGTYYDTITNPAACDSANYVITVNLTVNAATAATINPTACFSYTAPDNAVYTTSGTYNATIPNAAGCDSVITINLTINTVDLSITQNGLTLTSGASGAQYQWLDCSNNMPIAGETGQSFTVTVNGNYAVIVTQNSCTDTSACYFVNSVGDQELSAATVRAYPNPAGDVLTIESTGQGQLTLLNVAGEIVYTAAITKANSQHDVSALAEGVYFLQVNTAEGVSTQRVIIAR